MLRRLAVVVLAAALALAGCGSSKKKSATTKAPAAPAAAQTTAGCQKVSAPKPKGPQHLKPAKAPLSASKAWTVKLQTNCGEIDIRLDVAHAPKTTAAFAGLVRRGFFDGLTFHRIVPNFVIQGGDPLGNGQGGPGYTVVERPPKSTRYVRGVVAMAKTQTDPSGASGSQFFIVTGEDVGLPPIYALLGKVTGSFAAVDKISATPADQTTGQPQDAIVISKTTLASG